MPKYVIERDLPGIGGKSAADYKAKSQKSCSVLRDMDARVQWLESFVTDDKIYCIYLAPDEESIRAHGRRGGFPVNRISRVREVISPATAE